MRSALMRTGVARTVFSAWSWLVLGLLVAVWLPMVAVVRLVTAPFDKGRYAAGYLFRKLAVVHQRLNPMWRFRVSGDAPSDPRRPYVVVANHESFVDILLISHLPFEMKWLAKQEFFRIPAVGWMMRLAGDIPLRRGERDSTIAALAACRERLDELVSVMIFPEGTRSRTGELGEFKDGAFRLAIEAGVPVLPLAVHGARAALRAHDWRFEYATAEVRVLEPVETTGMTLADVGALRDRVRARIAAELDTMRASIDAINSENAVTPVGADGSPAEPPAPAA
jgi:1-acyl-sn-glycerol-3-phosphate acyltransferase